MSDIKKYKLSDAASLVNDRFGLKKRYNKSIDFLVSAKSSSSFNWLLISLIGLIYTLRAHQYIIKPQLYAEDGAVWLSSGYDKGIPSIFKPYNGLSHLFERLYGIFTAHLVPLQYEPAVYAITGLIIFLLVCYYMLSARSEVFANNYQKIFFAISMCLIANAEEFYFSFSDSVFLLGIVGIFLLVATKSRNKLINALEKILFLVLCFTIVFAWIYILILGFEFIWRRKKRYYYIVCALAGSVVQLFAYTHEKVQRPDIPIRYITSKATLFEFYNQIITPSLRFGRQDISPLTGNRTNLIFVSFVLLVSGLILLFVYTKANYKTKCLLFFCALITIISLKSPVNGQILPSAIVISMATYHWGNRYFIYGIIGMFVVWAKFSQELFKKQFLTLFISVFFIFGLLSSITLGSFYIQRDFLNLSGEYYSGVRQFEQNKNQLVVIPINPQGWYVKLGTAKDTL